MTHNWDEALLTPAEGPDAGDLGWTVLGEFGCPARAGPHRERGQRVQGWICVPDSESQSWQCRPSGPQEGKGSSDPESTWFSWSSPPRP